MTWMCFVLCFILINFFLYIFLLLCSTHWNSLSVRVCDANENIVESANGIVSIETPPFMQTIHGISNGNQNKTLTTESRKRKTRTQ